MMSETRPQLTYPIRNSLYINVTNACTAKCSFCPREDKPYVRGYNLRLTLDPTAEELMAAIDLPSPYEEHVFCGFGEPTLRLTTITTVARWLKEHGATVRLNTNGHGNLIHKRSIVPDLAACIDTVSVSLNATHAYEYNEIMNPAWGKRTFESVIEFINECRNNIPKVIITAVAFPGFDQSAFRTFVGEQLKLPWRIRAYDRLGD